MTDTSIAAAEAGREMSEEERANFAASESAEKRPVVDYGLDHFTEPVFTQEAYDKMRADLEEMKAARVKAIEEIKAQVSATLQAVVAERDALKAKVAEFEAKAAGNVESVAETVYKDAAEEAAAIKEKLHALLDEAKALAARLADIVGHPAMHAAVTFHRTLAGIKTLATELL